MFSSPLTKFELQERNRNLVDACREYEGLRMAIKESSQGRIDPANVDWQSPALRPSKLLRESVVSSALAQLLRYGVQQFMLDAYKQVPTVYEDLVTIITSQSKQEWYAPLYGAELPEDIADDVQFNDSRVEGLNTQVLNKGVGRLLSLSRNLWDDDQTGQIQQRVGKMGERMKIKEEQDTIAAIEGATYSLTLTGGGVNKFSGNTAITQAALESADQNLMGMVDPLGNNMLVRPNTILGGILVKFPGAKLLNSALQPSIPGASGENIGNATSGGTGWTMTQNPLQGLYALKISRFMNNTLNWFMCEARTSLVFQRRLPLEVEMESPNAGKSFDYRQVRGRVYSRYQVAMIESRYWFSGYNA